MNKDNKPIDDIHLKGLERYLISIRQQNDNDFFKTDTINMLISFNADLIRELKEVYGRLQNLEELQNSEEKKVRE